MNTLNTTDLGKFEGRDVEGIAVAVTNAGDGLSQAMNVDPLEAHLGDRVFVVLATTVDKVEYRRIKDEEGVTRVIKLKAGDATTVDEALVRDMLEAQRARIDEAKGTPQLDLSGGELDGDGFYDPADEDGS